MVGRTGTARRAAVRAGVSESRWLVCKGGWRFLPQWEADCATTIDGDAEPRQRARVRHHHAGLQYFINLATRIICNYEWRKMKVSIPTPRRRRRTRQRVAIAANP
jgi:hypothetical protein